MATPPNPNSLPFTPASFEVNVMNSANEKGSRSAPFFNIPADIPTLTFDTNPFAVDGAFASETGPRRGSFSDHLPHGHILPRAIDSLLPPTQGGLSKSTTGRSSLPPSLHDDSQTDSDPDFRSSGPSRRMSTAPRSVSDPDGSTINVFVTDTPFTSAPTSGATIQQSTSRRNKQYTLPDGSVVSGKGLGRGRPGIKRGPRNPKYQLDEGVSRQAHLFIATPATVNTTNTSPGKRRRTEPEPTILNMRSSTSTSISAESRESSEEYNPTATHTRSGRQTLKPNNLATASPARKTATNDSPNRVAPPAAIKTHPKIKRRVYRGREQFALCEHCLRGHGPPGNVIVFCDACNKCWHQRCHDPQIPKQTVSDSKAEWFCVDCDRILHGNKKGKKSENKPLPQAVGPALVAEARSFIYAGPRIGGRFMSPDQKVAYLNTLSREGLISLLLDASNLAPDLPMFHQLVQVLPEPRVPEAQLTSTYVTPVSKPPESGGQDAPKENDGVDEGYDGYFDEHSALYPKPGFGIQLPPESEDLHMLLEGKDTRTFSHWVRGMNGNEFSGTGNVAMN